MIRSVFSSCVCWGRQEWWAKRVVTLRLRYKEHVRPYRNEFSLKKDRYISILCQDLDWIHHPAFSSSFSPHIFFPLFVCWGKEKKKKVSKPSLPLSPPTLHPLHTSTTSSISRRSLSTACSYPASSLSVFVQCLRPKTTWTFQKYESWWLVTRVSERRRSSTRSATKRF